MGHKIGKKIYCTPVSPLSAGLWIGKIGWGIKKLQLFCRGVFFSKNRLKKFISQPIAIRRKWELDLPLPQVFWDFGVIRVNIRFFTNFSVKNAKKLKKNPLKVRISYVRYSRFPLFLNESSWNLADIFSSTLSNFPAIFRRFGQR